MRRPIVRREIEINDPDPTPSKVLDNKVIKVVVIVVNAAK